MKNIFLLIASFLLVQSPLYADMLDDAVMPFARVDTTFHATEYPILSPLRDGPVRVLFIGQRDIVGPLCGEVAARLDCRFDTILTPTRTSLGTKSPAKDFDFDALSEERIIQRAVKLLRKEWDVIWLDFEIGSLPEELRRIIMDRDGIWSGLVYTGDERDIRTVIEVDEINETPLYRLSYFSSKQIFAGNCDIGIIVVIPPLNTNGSALETTDYLNTAAYSIFCAAARKTGTTITRIQSPKKPIEQEAASIMNFRVHLFREGKPDSMQVHVRYRNEKGELTNKTAGTYIVDKDRSFVIINYPSLPIGIYSGDITVSDAEGIADFTGISFKVESSNFIKDVRLWDVSVPVGEFITGTIETSFEFKEGIVLTAELLDCRGRSMDKYNPEINPGRKNVDFTFKIRKTTDQSMMIRTEFYKNNELVQVFEKPFFIKSEIDSKNYYFVVCDKSETDFLKPQKYGVLRDAGVNGIAPDFSGTRNPAEAFRIGTDIVLSGVSILPGLVTFNGFDSTSEPGLSSAEGRRKTEYHLKAITDTLRQLSPLAYTANYDNVAITKSGRDFSEIDTKSLHEFLEHKYGSVEKLNNSWGTVYSSFSDAEPITIDEAKQSGAFTRWADTRFYQINRYAQIHSFVHDSIAAADSTVRVGIKDFQTVRNAYNGYDIPTLFKDFDVVISAYDAGTVMNGDFAITCALSSFMGTSVLRGLMVKGDKQSLSDETFLRTAPWQSLFLGMNSIWWDKFSGGAGSALSPDLSISPSFSVVAEESQEIMNGIDKLLLGAAIHRDGIGILYSPGSIIAAQILPEHGLNMVSSPDKNVLPESSNNVLKSARSFFLACKDLGYTPEFITENQVHENSLIDDGFSVLFLPYSRIISESALKRMKEFTNRGGTVIADVRPAVMGEDLSMRTSGALDEIFGISRETERTAHQGTGALKIIDTIDEDADTSDVTIPDFRGDSAVSVGDGAYARGRIGDYPVLIENSYEKGRGIFLNFGMEVYEKIRHNENERRIFLDVISRYIEAGGIDVPLVRIKEQGGNPEISANSSVFDDGAGKYIGIFMKPGSFLERTQLPKKYMMNIDFTENIYYVYNVRNGMFLGALSDIPIEFSPGRPELFALLPYRVKKLSLEIDKSVIRPGEKIAYNVTIEPQEKNTVPGRHIIRVGLLDPDGKEMQNFTDSYETFQGNFESSFQISRENPPGRWILTVQDIATGKKSERAFMIMSDKKGY